jgi:hypothetical protein
MSTHVSQQLDTVVQLMPFHHLFQVDLLRAVAADDKVDIGVLFMGLGLKYRYGSLGSHLLADHRDDVNHKVYALAIHQARDSDDGNNTRLARGGVGREQSRVDSVGDDRNLVNAMLTREKCT